MQLVQGVWYFRLLLALIAIFFTKLLQYYRWDTSNRRHHVYFSNRHTKITLLIWCCSVKFYQSSGWSIMTICLYDHVPNWSDACKRYINRWQVYHEMSCVHDVMSVCDSWRVWSWKCMQVKVRKMKIGPFLCNKLIISHISFLIYHLIANLISLWNLFLVNFLSVIISRY